MFWQMNNYTSGQNIKKPSESTKEQSKASRHEAEKMPGRRERHGVFCPLCKLLLLDSWWSSERKPQICWLTNWGTDELENEGWAREGEPQLCINCPHSCKPLNYTCVRQTPCNQLRLSMSAAAHPEETEPKLREIHRQLKQVISNGWNLSYINHTSVKSSPLHQGGKIKMLLDKRKLRESVVIQPPLHVLEGEGKLYQMEAQISEKHVSKHKNIFSS